MDIYNVEMVMSYLVTVPRDADATNWFPNAVNNAWVKHKPTMRQKKNYTLPDYWALEYDSTVGLDDKGRWVVSFPTEQDYTWFLLKWG